MINILLPILTVLIHSVCGLRFQEKILGGTEVVPNSWPWMASIQFNYQHICGGTLINNQFILTAAHCIYFGYAPSAYKIILGGHNISEAGINANSKRVSVTKIIVHENFVRSRFLNDVALIKLDKPVEFSREIFPACLPLKTDSFENTICNFIGWGLTYNGGAAAEIPREISLPILNQETCKNYVITAVEQKYCSGSTGSYQDTCQGDSGSGQMCMKPDGLWYVGGIVSYGEGSCGNVGIQARVDYQRDWIDKNIAENF